MRRCLPPLPAPAATAEMVAKRGRASRLGERSLGHVDPGAQSVVYLLTTFDDGAAGALRVGELLDNFCAVFSLSKSCSCTLHQFLKG